MSAQDRRDNGGEDFEPQEKWNPGIYISAIARDGLL